MLLSLFLVALLSWQMVHWGQVFYQPRAPKVHSAVQIFNPEATAEQIGTRQLFGLASVAIDSPQMITPLNFKLSGIFSVDGSFPSVAIISVDNKDGLPFRTGDAVAPDVTLEQVMADHVILSRAGVKEKLLLESKSPVLIIPVTKPALNPS